MSGDQPEPGGSSDPPPKTDSASREPGPGPKPDATPGDTNDAATTKHPLGDQSGPENETYRRGRFRTEGNAAFFTKSKIKNSYAGSHYTIFADGRSKKTSARVRPKVLVRIRQTYALVPLYERTLATVREHRVAVLRGLPGTGLSTTAVHLLDVAAEGRVARLDLTGGVGVHPEKDLVKKHGYVIRIPASDSDGTPTGIALDALCELLAERECYACCWTPEGLARRTNSTSTPSTTNRPISEICCASTSCGG